MRAALWTPQEVELGKELLARGASQAECQALLGRTRQAVRDKMNRDELASIRNAGVIYECPVRVPPHVLEDRNRRLMAERTLTGFVCGDPPLGYSALERRA